MTLTTDDVHEYCHQFALATIECLNVYLTLLGELPTLIDSPDLSDWEERMASARKGALQIVMNFAPVSAALTELDLGHRLPELQPDDDVRPVQTLMQAIITAAGVLAFVDTYAELERAVLLTPDAIGRLLAHDGVEATLAGHFERETGTELGSWPHWAPSQEP